LKKARDTFEITIKKMTKIQVQGHWSQGTMGANPPLFGKNLEKAELQLGSNIFSVGQGGMMAGFEACPLFSGLS